MTDQQIEEVNHLKKKLDKGVSFEKTMHILYKLQKIPISVKLLEETGIGYKLRELSKHEKNNDIGKTAKLLIVAWKQLLKNQEEEEEEEHEHDSHSIQQTSSSDHNNRHNRYCDSKSDDNRYHNNRYSDDKQDNNRYCDTKSDADSSCSEPDSSNRAALPPSPPQHKNKKHKKKHKQKTDSDLKKKDKKRKHKVDCDKESKRHKSMAQSMAGSMADSMRQERSEGSASRHKQHDSFSEMLSSGDQVRVNKTSSKSRHTSDPANLTESILESLSQSISLPPPKPEPVKPPAPVLVGMKFKGRTQVYAGSSKVITVPEVYRLQDICIRMLMNHVDKIYEVGDLPYFILKPVFTKCTVQQLKRIEHYNPQLLEDTDELWREFCCKDFKQTKMVDRARFGSWRELYAHLLREREEKLRNITTNINKKQRLLVPERKTQQIDLKMPREIRRRQERVASAPYSSSSSSSSYSHNRPSSSSGSLSKCSITNSNTNKPKTAPLMKKLLQMRQKKFRR